MKKATKIVYVASARLPTEKAHGLQIFKMCEGFALNNAEVLLLHPFRHQRDSNLSRQTPFQYYAVPPIFRLRTLPNIDAIALLECALTDRFFHWIVFTHALLWGLYAALAARAEHADLHYTRESHIAFWLVKLGMPTVYEAHHLPRRGQRWLLRQVAQSEHLKRVIALTSFIGGGLCDLAFPKAKITILPDAVDAGAFACTPPPVTCRHKLNLPTDRPIIGYLGRFQTLGMEKGIAELIQAVARLSHSLDRKPLLLCVGGPMDVVPAYLRIAGSLGLTEDGVRFVDRVPTREVPFWIKSFDIATMPFPDTEHYRYFMSPLKLFEYMAAGVPIVASDLPSLREVLRHGHNGWLVAPGDSSALAQAFQHLLADRDLAVEIGSTAQRDAQAFTWAQRAGTILARCGAGSYQAVFAERAPAGSDSRPRT